MTKILSKTLSLIMLLAGSLTAEAASVTLINASGTKYFTSTGSALPVGTLLRIGYFATGTTAATISSSDYTAVNAAFIPLGTGNGTGSYVTGQNTANASGTFTDGANAAPSIDGIVTGTNVGQVPTGTPIYVWILNPDKSEWAISRDTAAASVYKTPTADTGIGSAVSISPVTVGSAAEVFFGSYVAGSPNQIRMALANPVPEPTSLAVLTLGSMMAFSRRRKS